MSRSAKDKQIPGRRQNGEREPFLVEEISRSPVMRGRRQNSEEERVVVENISRSPVARGRRQNSEEERFIIENIPRSPVSRGKRLISEEQSFLLQDTSRNPVIKGKVSKMATSTRTTTDAVDASSNAPNWNSTQMVVNDNPVSSKATTSVIGVHSICHNEPPDTEDAPPSYESTIPTNHIGWSPHVTSKVPFPMPQMNDLNDERLTFNYPPSCPYPLMKLSPVTKSHRSFESPDSNSLGTSPSTSPSPHRLRPAYAYQQRPIPMAITTTRPVFRRNYENDFSDKAQNEPSYRYGGLIVAIFFVVFMMLLSLSVKFIVTKHTHQ